MDTGASKKRLFSIILIGILLGGGLLVLFSSPIKGKMAFENAKGELKNYFLNDFDISKIKPGPESSLYSWQKYLLILGMIRTLRKEDVSSQEVNAFNEIAVDDLFKKECPGNNPEKCSPLKTLTSYYMFKTKIPTLLAKAGAETKDTQKIENPYENTAFSQAVDYWQGIIKSKTLEEKDLDDVLGTVIIKKQGGGFDEKALVSLANRVIDINIERSQPAEKRILSTYKKVRILEQMAHPLTIEELFQAKGMLSKDDARTRLCKVLDVNELKKINNVCTTLYFSRIQVFCTGTPTGKDSAGEFYSLAARQLKERYSGPEEILCQLGLLGVKP